MFFFSKEQYIVCWITVEFQLTFLS